MPSACRYVLPALILALALAAVALPARAQRPGDFDSYLLALSWSPTYCASQEGQGARPQCGPGRRYAFVVHGLWPQYERGWPQHCDTRERWVAERVIDGMLDVMPSKRLIINQWKKHGTCSGLTQRAYFAAVRDVFARIRVPARYAAPDSVIHTSPEQLATDFLKTNPWMTPDMIQVECGNRRDRGYLGEIRFCLTRGLQPRACGHNERRSCRADTLIMPPVR